MRGLAVVRAERESPDVFLETFIQVLERLEPVAQENEERWKELTRFALSWGIQRRGAEERDRLRAVARQVQTSIERKERIDSMGQTIAEYYIAQGEIKGELKGKREGERKGLSTSLLKTLSWRFPNQVSPETAAKVQNQDDPETLAQWLDSALQAESWDGFRASAGL